MTPLQSPDTVRNNKIINFIMIIVMAMGILFFVLDTPVHASQTGTNSQVAIAAQTTPQPEGELTQIPEEVIREGQPTGIIFGAIVIVLIILGGTAPLLLKR
jgi:hypothetical protein